MARDINKTRMRNTRILMAIVLLMTFFTSPVIPEGSFVYLASKLTGFILLTACAIGRIYSTAFIGGAKNEKLMTAGPYSMCRNPLYFYSLLGAAGVGLMSVQVTSFIIIFGGFLWIYSDLIKREEEFLLQKFGAVFDTFRTTTPRLLPNIKKYTCPPELVFQPRYLNMAVRDAVWWFAAVPLFELAHMLQQAGIIKPLFSVF